MADRATPPTLGAVMKGIRARNGWTLKEMSAKSGIPVSTLSKVEHDRLTLSYDKLQQLSQRLSIRMADLFAEDQSDSAPRVTGRRSVGTIDQAVRVTTDNYDYHYLCTELRQKRMIPIVTHVRARTLDEFGDLVRHSGEEWIYVVSGRIRVHTEFYETITLETGQSVYLDSNMGHAYVLAEGCDEAVVIGACASGEPDQMQHMLEHHSPVDHPA